MSAGKITLVSDTTEQVTYLFYVNSNGDLAGFSRRKMLVLVGPPVEEWETIRGLPSAPGGFPIAQIKGAIVPSAGKRLLTLVSRDAGADPGDGQIWWTAYDLLGQSGWSRWATAGSVANVQDFDIVWNVNYPTGPFTQTLEGSEQSAGGLLVFFINARNSTGLITFDGANWNNDGWPNSPGANTTQYQLTNDGVEAPLTMPFPPSFTSVSVDNNNAGHEDESVPFVCGQCTQAVTIGGFPYGLYPNQAFAWAWSVLPTQQEQSVLGGQNVTFTEPPGGAVATLCLTFPLMFLINGPFCTILLSNDISGASWATAPTFTTSGSNQIKKVTWTYSSPVVAIALVNSLRGGTEFQFLYSATMNGAAFQAGIEDPGNVANHWAWSTLLPLVDEQPASLIEDFDLAQGFSNVSLIVAMLGADGNAYVVYQSPEGPWTTYYGKTGTGLP